MTAESTFSGAWGDRGFDGQSLSGDTTTTFVVTAPLTDQVPKCSPVLMVRDLKLCTEEDLWQL